EDGIRDDLVTGVQTCALPILQGFAPCFALMDSAELYPPTHQLENAGYRTASNLVVTVINANQVQLTGSVQAGQLAASIATVSARSEERRVGKECRCGWGPCEW